jgi:hypothetical protein
VAGRILDVSERVSKLLGYFPGMSRVRLDYLGKAGPAGGGEDRVLLASLRVGEESVAVAQAARQEDGVSTVARTPALGYSEPQRPAPAAAALAAAVRPPAASAAPAPLSLAAHLDASARQLEVAIEAARTSAAMTAKAVTPYGELVVSPFKRLIEASR